jgi:putative transposase
LPFYNLSIASLSSQIELSKFIANLKTVSSRLIRKEFGDYLGKIYTNLFSPTGSYLLPVAEG